MKIVIKVLFVSVLFCCHSAAYACSCMEVDSPAIAFARNDIVFSGEVDHIKYDKVEYGENATVYFKVKKAFRGNISVGVQVDAGISGGMCGYPFKNGGEYLVYAMREETGYATSLCSRTRPLPDAGEDLKFLESIRLEVVNAAANNIRYLDPEGQLLAEMNCADKDRTCLSKSYINGVLVEEISYKNDRVTDRKRFREDGSLELETNYTDGYISSYYESGKLKRKAEYKNGKLEGREINYFEDGSIESEATYRAGDIVNFKVYDKSGNIIQEEEY